MYEVLQQVAVDETNHRDVNHTRVTASDDPNPYVAKHAEAQAASAAYWQAPSAPSRGAART